MAHYMNFKHFMFNQCAKYNQSVVNVHCLPSDLMFGSVSTVENGGIPGVMFNQCATNNQSVVNVRCSLYPILMFGSGSTVGTGGPPGGNHDGGQGHRGVAGHSANDGPADDCRPAGWSMR